MIRDLTNAPSADQIDDMHQPWDQQACIETQDRTDELLLGVA